MTFRRLLVAVQLVAFLGGAGEAWLFRCGGDRLVRTRCCCPEGKPAPIPTIETGTCCSLERGAPAREAAACPAPPDRTNDEAAPAVVVAILASPPRPRLAAPARTRSLGPPGPPTLLDQRTAFLL
jgi:hypothetical protein